MIATFARASRSAISTSLSPSGAWPHFLINRMSLSTNGEIATTLLGKERSSSRQGPPWFGLLSFVNLPVETCSVSSIGRECSSEHGRTAFRLLFRGLILNDIPMLHEFPGFNTHNVSGDPIHRSTEIAESTVHDHEVSFGHDRSRFVLQCWRDVLDEIEQTVATRSDMSAVLNVVRRPESFCGRIVTPVEERVERFQDEGLVLFRCSLRHVDSFRA